MTLNLIKIEEGLFDGDVMYHKLYQKTEEEKKKIRIAREKAKKEKEKRTREQLLNVKKKERAKDAHKDKSLAGMQKKIKGNFLHIVLFFSHLFHIHNKHEYIIQDLDMIFWKYFCLYFHPLHPMRSLTP